MAAAGEAAGPAAADQHVAEAAAASATRRLAEAEGRRPVYVPISIYAPLCLGATRRERTGVNLEVYDLLRETKRGSPAFLAFMASLKAPSMPERIV